jgi:hypothetical protein
MGAEGNPLQFMFAISEDFEKSHRLARPSVLAQILHHNDTSLNQTRFDQFKNFQRCLV